MSNIPGLEEFLRRRFGSVKRGHGCNGLQFTTKCPVCGREKLSINAASGLYRCWRGCVSGHIGRLLGDIRIAKTDTFAAKRRDAFVKRDVDIPGELVPLTTLGDDHQAIVYLRDRGFDAAMLDAFYGIRHCASGKRYAGGLFDTTNTLIIPIYSSGELIGWQSRLLYDPNRLNDSECEALRFEKDEDGEWARPPKYFTSPGLNKGKILWNTDWARHSNLVVVCEGVFDAIAVGRCAVAAFGKNITEHQANILKAYWDLVVILLDPGDADEQAIKLRETLGKGSVPAVYVTLRGYKDAGEAPRDEIWRQIDAAIAKEPAMAAARRTLDAYRFLV